jgi:spore coat protein U-like protein
VSRITATLTALFILFLWTDDSAGQGRGRCWVSTTSVNFGSYDVFSATPADSTGTVSVYCNQENFVTASIGPSPNSGGFNPRQMRLATGTDLMNYNLYRDTTRTQIWGDGTGGSFLVSGTVTRRGTEIYTVYGRIPPGQDISAGLYMETLTVTLTW